MFVCVTGMCFKYGYSEEKNLFKYQYLRYN